MLPVVYYIYLYKLINAGKYISLTCEVDIMKKNLRRLLIIAAAALVLLMLLSMAACGKEELPAPTETPVADVSLDAAQEQPSPSPSPENLLPSATPVPTADAEGLLTFTSMSKGFSFQYDQKYIALSNPADNAMVYAAGDTELPFCSVSIITGTNAVDYLKELAAGMQTELGDSMETAPGEPEKIPYGERDIYYFYYTYKDDEAGGDVISAYYGENLESGDVVIYNSTALVGATEDADAILKLAIETFKMD